MYSIQVWSSFVCFSFSPSLSLSELSLQIEDIVTQIQDLTDGVPIRTVKSFMTKIPSVVTGEEFRKKFTTTTL